MPGSEKIKLISVYIIRMTSYVLAHIIGLVSSAKLINKLTDKYANTVLVVDLDQESSKVQKEPSMVRWHKAGNKQQLYQYWVKRMQKFVDHIIKDNSGKKKPKKIIFLGLSNHPDNRQRHLKLYTNNKFFVSQSPEVHAKKTIEYNLTKYRQNIIDGKFPLKYLDLQYLIDRRTRIIETYQKRGYQLKTVQVVSKMLNCCLSQHKCLQDIKHLYVGLSDKHDGEITGNRVVAYTHEWLALASIIPNVNRKVTKGYLNGKPFIKEKARNGLNVFNTKGYLYQVDKSTFEFCKKGQEFKLVSEGPVKIVKRTYVSNIFTRLGKDKNKIRLLTHSDKL